MYFSEKRTKTIIGISPEMLGEAIGRPGEPSSRMSPRMDIGFRP